MRAQAAPKFIVIKLLDPVANQPSKRKTPVGAALPYLASRNRIQPKQPSWPTSTKQEVFKIGLPNLTWFLYLLAKQTMPKNPTGKLISGDFDAQIMLQRHFYTAGLSGNITLERINASSPRNTHYRAPSLALPNGCRCKRNLSVVHARLAGLPVHDLAASCRGVGHASVHRFVRRGVEGRKSFALRHHRTSLKRSHRNA